MGAWGYEPYDNDDAGDWLDGSRKDIAKRIAAALKRKDDESVVVAACSLLLDLDKTPLDLGYEARQAGLYDKAHDALAAVLGEQSPKRVKAVVVNGRRVQRGTWVDSWKDPGLMRSSLCLLQHRLWLARLLADESHVKAALARVGMGKLRRRAKRKPAPKS